MSSRHTRRKAAKARQEAKTLAIAQAYRSSQIAKVVRNNLAAPIDRNYYPQSSFSDLQSRAAFAHGASGKRLRDLPNNQVKKSR